MQVVWAIVNWLMRRKAYILCGAIGMLIAYGATRNAWAAIGAITVAILPAFFTRDPVPAPLAPEDATVEIASDPLFEVKAAFAGFDSPVFLLDRGGYVLYQNPSAAHAFGEFRDGQHVSARIRLPAILDTIRETLNTGKTGTIEYSAMLPSESVYLVRIIKAQGEADYYILIFRDISETRRIDRMRSDFVANASHELRTPLASLRGFIETLMGPARNDQKAHENFLGIMQEQVTRMSRLVDDLMSLSRLELKARLAPHDAVDLVPLIGSVCDALAPLAGDVGVEIVKTLPAQPVMVTGDRDELTQVFENLIENACKYGQDGKKVDVTISAEPDQPVEVGVRDYGPGIPDEHVPRLTERFYRVNVESSRSKKGTGLGLAIVKHILTRHRARLIIRSEVGQGSTFTVRF
ncbi:MAG: phoR [Rhizobium sp.]|nr:phoR [Rhizobium sp.]